MTVMVDDLFELSRIHAGTLQLSLQQVGVRDLVSESIAGATEIARSGNVTVDGSIDPGLEVEVDPGALSRVVGKLVMNAIRHTPDDGVVVVNGHHDATMVELSVTDACGGIDDADLERVFAWPGVATRPGPPGRPRAVHWSRVHLARRPLRPLGQLSDRALAEAPGPGTAG